MMKPLLFVGLSALVLAGCSSTASKNAQDTIDYDAETDYRDSEDKLNQKLEMPPNLFAMSNKQDGFDDAVKSKQGPEEAYQYIPTYHADNVSVESNLSERWLQIKGMNSQDVWKGVQDFLVSLGFEVVEARKDIGFIRTKFTARKVLAPLDDQGPLTKLLNSWRPELAEGIYDRLIARVQYHPESGNTSVYFYHAMVVDPSQTDADQIVSDIVSDGWRIKPYNPMIEAEALYQAMIFFGATQTQAFDQVKATVEMMETVTDDKEVTGMRYETTPKVVWDYLVAMIYRADWSMDEMKPQTYEAIIRIPEKMREDDSIGSTLAFWSDKKEKTLPKRVKFSLTSETKGDKASTVLAVDALEGQRPLTGEQRQRILKALGLLSGSKE